MSLCLRDFNLSFSYSRLKFEISIFICWPCPPARNHSFAFFLASEEFCSNPLNSFSLFFIQVEIVFLGTPNFSDASLFVIPFSISLIILHFCNILVFFSFLLTADILNTIRSFLNAKQNLIIPCSISIAFEFSNSNA